MNITRGKKANPKRSGEKSAYKVDNKDFEILQFLRKNARMSVAQIADKCKLSRTFVYKRLHNMQEAGVIIGIGCQVDMPKIGYNLCAFVDIYLRSGSTTEEAIKFLKTIDEANIYFSTGRTSLVLQINVRDANFLEKVLNDIRMHSGLEVSDCRLFWQR